jgi:hypothetical protein
MVTTKNGMNSPGLNTQSNSLDKENEPEQRNPGTLEGISALSSYLYPRSSSNLGNGLVTLQKKSAE